jgi:hypothetical protein
MSDQDIWGDKTMMREVKTLQSKLEEKAKRLDEAEEHTKTVAEIKVVMKWVKVLAVTITTIAGSIIALKSLNVI